MCGHVSRLILANYVEKLVIEQSVYSAVSNFNDGGISMVYVFGSLGLAAGRFMTSACKKRHKKM